ncbi:MAG: hypothetical protein CUN55_12745 [Phototrophicales bacterium]|nr:MAG: hypothetical protein CUN55_12745 [Phototrophicales bacterium]
MANIRLRSPSSGDHNHTIPITLYLPDTHQQISLALTYKAFIGRLAQQDTEDTVYVDLTSVGGYEHGISRRHMMLVYDPNRDEIFAFDLDSQNGSLLNGQLMSSHTGYELKHGDELRLGTLNLRFYRSARVPFDDVEVLEPRATPERTLAQTQVLKLPHPKPDIRSTLQTRALRLEEDETDDE